MVRAIVMQTLHRMDRLSPLPLTGSSKKSPTTVPLNLQPGEWVRIRSRSEIAQTLTDKGANRGLYFDREMMALCGRTFQVRARVTKIIDEKTGQMIEMTSDCLKLEGAVCSGELSTGRWFCPRDIPSYWRECWLERIDPPAAATRVTVAAR
jgi:hypothetical protein